MLPNFSYARPRTLNEAQQILESEEAYIHAGGTDLLGCLRDGILPAKTIVSLAELDELKGITLDADGSMRIGALTKVAQVAGHPAINERYPLLAEAAHSVASPQLRNQGTIGGNLCQRPRCWYFRGRFDCIRTGGENCSAAGGQNEFHCIFGGESCYFVHPSDTAPALVALDANVKTASLHGGRTIPLADFFCLPSQDVFHENVLKKGEILTEIVLPKPPSHLLSTYRKVRARSTWDFSLASVAVALEIADRKLAKAHLVLGAAAAIPWRAKEAEQALQGEELKESTATKAAELAMSGAEPLEKNAYKVALFQGLIIETLLGLATKIQ